MNNRAAAFAQAARGPVLLILLGFLFALQQSGTLSFARSWPLLIIVIGCMKLVERMVAAPASYVPPPAAAAPPSPYGVPYRTPPPPPRPGPPPPTTPGGAIR